ncbi:hypothetical protein GYH30_025576 [Glycine max]|nr:hypothetical protein GYH30_025576 [Glycine max]
MNQRTPHKRVRLKPAFGYNATNLFSFFHRVRIGARLDYHGELEAVRERAGAVHARERNDHVEVALGLGVPSERGVPRGAVWLRRFDEHSAGVANSAEARPCCDETRGDVIVALDYVGHTIWA